MQKIIRGFEFFFWIFLRVVPSRFRVAIVVALLTRLGAHLQGPAILTFSQLKSERDLHALIALTDLEFFQIPHWVMLRLSAIFIPKNFRAKGSEALFAEKKSRRYRRLIREHGQLFDQLRTKINVTAIVSGNVSEWFEMGLRRSCQERSLPFVIVCKENAVSDEAAVRFSEHLSRNQVDLDGIITLVGNSKTREAIISGAKADPDSVVVTGLPRLEHTRFLKIPPTSEPSILLLSFFNGYGADAEFLDVAEAIISGIDAEVILAKSLTIKVKSVGEIELLRSILVDSLGSLRLSRVRWDASRCLSGVIGRSHVVVGFKSMALAESLWTGRPCVVPVLGDMEWDASLAPDGMTEHGLTFPRSLTDLFESVNLALSGGVFIFDTPQRFAFTESLMSRPDEGPTAAVYREINSRIMKSIADQIALPCSEVTGKR